MRKNIILLAVFTLSVLIVSSCKKYEEDDSISLKSVKTRLVRTWVTYEIVPYNADFIGTKMTIYEDGKLSMSDKNGYTYGNFLWQLSSDKKEFHVIHTSDGSISKWNIIKLTNKNFWIKTEIKIDNDYSQMVIRKFNPSV